MTRVTTDSYHQELMNEVRAQSRPLTPAQREKLTCYIGTSKAFYAMETDAQRRIVKQWIKAHDTLTSLEYVELLNSLYKGSSCNEISIAGDLLQLLPKLRKDIDPALLEKWLDRVEGWGETDSICQSKFTAEEVLSRWKEWKRMLNRFSLDDNVHKKRASLVLLTKPVRESGDTRLADMAFANIDRLKGNREILVTKAISWLLRDLIRNHRQRVEEYLKQNELTLPKIAIRETRTKLLTGRKTPLRAKKR